VDLVRHPPQDELTLSSTVPPQVWDIATQKVTHRFIGHEGTVTSLTVSTDGNFLASASTSGDDRYVSSQP